MSDDEQKQYLLDWFKRYPASLDAKYAGSPPPDRPGPAARAWKQPRHRPAREAEVDEEIDLHGETITEGLFALEQLLARARAARYHCVRVVHGTGEPGTHPTLRREIRRWLETKAGSGMERWAYEDASEGAVIIWIKRSPNEK